MAYSICHAPLKLCHLNYNLRGAWHTVHAMLLSNYKWDATWNSYNEKVLFSQTFNSFSNNLILCFSQPGPEVIKLFSCSTQLSMKFSPLINVKSHSLRASKSGGNRKNRFSCNFAHFWLVSRDERKCIYFLFFLFRFHGNHDFLVLAFFRYFSKLKLCI